MNGHSFLPDSWRCEHCDCLATSFDATLPCPGAQHDDTAPGDAETAERIIDWSRINAESSGKSSSS